MTWFNSPALPNPNKITDSETLVKWLEFLGKSKFARFHIHSDLSPKSLGGSWSAFVGMKTVKRAIKNFYTDLEVWCYANPMKAAPVSINGRTRTTWRPMTNRNWVLDLDNLLISNTDGLIASLIDLGAPLPHIASQTSDGSYHLFYSTLNDNFWTTQNRMKLAAMVVGVKPSRSEDKTEESLKAAGVDLNYLSQDPGSSKFRIPGSGNIGALAEKKENVTVSGWFNVNYKPEDTLRALGAYKPIDQLYKDIPKGKEVNLRKSRTGARYKKVLLGLIDDCITKESKIKNKIALFLSKDSHWLRQKECRINQMHLGKILGISQPEVSRLLRKLATNKILEVQNGGEWTWGMSHGGKSKTYGFGAKALIEIEKVDTEYRKGLGYKIDEEYSDGDSWRHTLADVRSLLASGRSIENIVEIIMKKQENRPKNKTRSKKEIERMCENWIAKIGEFNEIVA